MKIPEGQYEIEEPWRLYIDGELETHYVEYVEVREIGSGTYEVEHYNDEHITTVTVDEQDVIEVLGDKELMENEP